MLAYFVRHGESQGNAGLSSDPDCGLSDLGLLQAKRLPDRLADQGIKAIYTSPMRRAIETALPLAERLGMAAWVRPDLAEHFSADFLNLQGFVPQDITELCRRWPHLEPDPALQDDPVGWPVWPESVEALAARMRRLVEHLKATWADSDAAIVVFSHGAPVARAVEAWIIDEPGPEYRFSIANATINLLSYSDGVSTVLALNDASHLL